MNEIVYDPRAASAFLRERGHRASEQTLAKLRSIGGGPLFQKFGRHVRYPESALEAWMKARTTALKATSSRMAA
jgi:hypothetical protein